MGLLALAGASESNARKYSLKIQSSRWQVAYRSHHSQHQSWIWLRKNLLPEMLTKLRKSSASAFSIRKITRRSVKKSTNCTRICRNLWLSRGPCTRSPTSSSFTFSSRSQPVAYTRQVSLLSSSKRKRLFKTSSDVRKSYLRRSIYALSRNEKDKRLKSK